MKKLLLITVFMAIVTTMMAQNRQFVKIEKSDGSFIEYPTTEIKNITFEDLTLNKYDLWLDFTPLFGYSKETVKSVMNDFGYTFLMSDNSYSIDGVDYYSVLAEKYVQYVGFVQNPHHVVSEIWVYYTGSDVLETIYSTLQKEFKEAKDEDGLVFYNDERTLKVTLNVKLGAVVYTNLMMEQHVSDSKPWIDYWEGLNMTEAQITEKFGTPYTTSENSLYYFANSQYINICMFNIDADTKLCTRIYMIVKEGVEPADVVNYLNSQYTVYEKGTMEDGSQYAWINASSSSEATMGILYNVTDGYFIYDVIKKQQ